MLVEANSMTHDPLTQPTNINESQYWVCSTILKHLKVAFPSNKLIKLLISPLSFKSTPNKTKWDSLLQTTAKQQSSIELSENPKFKIPPLILNTLEDPNFTIYLMESINVHK
jgi:hypothetical protein